MQGALLQVEPVPALGVTLSVLGKAGRCRALVVVAGIKVMCAAVCMCVGELVARLVLYICTFIVVAHTLVLVRLISVKQV